MSRSSRLVFSIAVLLCVSCAIYFVALGDSQSLGQAGSWASLKLSPGMDVPASAKPEFQPAEELPAELTNEILEEEADFEKANGESKEKVTEAPAEDAHENLKEDTQYTSELAADGFTETPFMPKMANETLKAKLGNSAWHLFHTVLARYPDEPTTPEKVTLKQYIHLFAQVYPCGDCARHFSQLLQRYPVQVESRKTAALWGCHIHNKVNERLEKPEYDCTKILEDYDCGCGDDEKEEDSTLGNESVEHLRKITLDEKEGKQLGG